MRFRSSGIRFLLTTIILLFLTSVSLADGLDSPDTATASINPLWLQHEQHPVEKRLVGNWSTFFVLGGGIWL